MTSKNNLVAILFSLSSLALYAQPRNEAAFKRTCYALVEFFQQKNIREINKLINPKIGVYIITRPGAMDDFKYEKKLDEQNPFANYAYTDTFRIKKYSLKYGTAPKYDCGTETWNKKGFVADSTTNYKRISGIMKFRTKYESAKYSKEETASISTGERVNRKVVFTDLNKEHGIVLYLTFIGGKWYLFAIDTVASLCGA